MISWIIQRIHDDLKATISVDCIKYSRIPQTPLYINPSNHCQRRVIQCRSVFSNHPPNLTLIESKKPFRLVKPISQWNFVEFPHLAVGAAEIARLVAARDYSRLSSKPRRFTRRGFLMLLHLQVSNVRTPYNFGPDVKWYTNIAKAQANRL